MVISTIESSYNYQIMDIQGNIINEKNNVKGESIISFSEFKAGVYFISLIKDNQLIKTKFAVQ